MSFVLNAADLHDQAGMERAFRGYFEEAEKAFPGTFNVLLGCELETCGYEDSFVVLRLAPKPWMANPMNILHGGVTASVLDMTMGLLCRYCSGGSMTPTVSMDVQYLRSGPLDKTLYIRADLTKRGLSVCYANGRLWAGEDEKKPIATASGAYFVTGRRRA